jgi:hypothetical protein
MDYLNARKEMMRGTLSHWNKNHYHLINSSLFINSYIIHFNLIIYSHLIYPIYISNSFNFKLVIKFINSMSYIFCLVFKLDTKLVLVFYFLIYYILVYSSFFKSSVFLFIIHIHKIMDNTTS